MYIYRAHVTCTCTEHILHVHVQSTCYMYRNISKHILLNSHVHTMKQGQLHTNNNYNNNNNNWCHLQLMTLVKIYSVYFIHYNVVLYI